MLKVFQLTTNDTTILKRKATFCAKFKMFSYRCTQTGFGKINVSFKAQRGKYLRIIQFDEDKNSSLPTDSWIIYIFKAI